MLKELNKIAGNQIKPSNTTDDTFYSQLFCELESRQTVLLRATSWVTIGSLCPGYLHLAKAPWNKILKELYNWELK